MRIVFLILIFFAICLTSCVEKFWPNIDKYEHVLVVDGLLTAGDVPIEVRLSYSSSVGVGDFIPATNGELFVIKEDGLEILLYETEPGVYKSKDSVGIVEIGSDYQLSINLPDGKKYLSEFTKLQEASPIDSVYWYRETKEEKIGVPEKDGIRFYLDNHSTNCDTCYYMWKLGQTYKYKASFALDYLWVGQFVPFPNPDSLRVCYHTSKLSDIIIETTKYSTDATIKRKALNFVSTDNKLLSIRYSLEVNQLSVNKKAFDFFHAIEQQNIEQGDLYSKQPMQIRGNVKNVTDTDEPVLGYFIVAGLTKKRIFISRPNIPFTYIECVPDYESMAWIQFEPPQSWPFYITDIMFKGLAMGQSNSCFDCRLDGGSLTPPSFWVE